jgi:hypothetical protein
MKHWTTALVAVCLLALFTSDAEARGRRGGRGCSSGYSTAYYYPSHSSGYYPSYHSGYYSPSYRSSYYSPSYYPGGYYRPGSGAHLRFGW